jgi:hypothetical protein
MLHAADMHMQHHSFLNAAEEATNRHDKILN